jgi:hypothetical protein
MPQGSNANRGDNNKKGRAPAHQNAFAFVHNPKSKKTEKILNAPNVHVCRRCFDKIEWRKKYRKYKPRTQPGKCNLCQKRTVLAAYHTICSACTTSDKARKSIVMTQQQEATDEIDKSNNVNENSTSNEHCYDNVDELLAQSAGELSVEDSSSSSCQRVCAICVKEAALPDEDEGPDTIDDLLARENRRLKLRERISLERKLLREQEEEKQAAKEERRREREAQADDEVQSHADIVPLEDLLLDDDNDNHDVLDARDEEDPFLQAVGGESKLLTGEAYQKMLLEREQQGLENES